LLPTLSRLSSYSYHSTIQCLKDLVEQLCCKQKKIVMPYTLLVVEDELDVRENLTEILTENSYKVVTAANGHDAMKKLTKNIPDLIISDITMPVMDGFELLEYVQSSKNFSHIPFVFLTAKSSMQEMRSGMSLGADDYLTKPFRASELLDIVRIKLKKKESIQKQLNEIKESIALSIPHEFRTPLTPIVGFSSMLSEDLKSLTPEEIEEMSSAILASALRLRTSVEKFILFSTLHYELNNFESNHAIRNNIVQDIEFRILDVVVNEKKYKSGTIGFESKVEECRLKIDETYFGICIKELVENAFKFSFDNTKVKITGKNTGDYYELAIENTGGWLSKDQIKKIDVLTKQYDPTMPGSGLGLPIVKRIVEYFGGIMEVISKHKKYTKVTINILLAD
jgi:two-component system, sensor histidine kinase and response regulator